MTDLVLIMLASCNAHDQSRLAASTIESRLAAPRLLLLLLLGTHVTLQAGNPITPDDQPCGCKGCCEQQFGKDCGCSTFVRENNPLAGPPALRKPHYTWNVDTSYHLPRAGQRRRQVAGHRQHHGQHHACDAC